MASPSPPSFIHFKQFRQGKLNFFFISFLSLSFLSVLENFRLSLSFLLVVSATPYSLTPLQVLHYNSLPANFEIPSPHHSLASSFVLHLRSFSSSEKFLPSFRYLTSVPAYASTSVRIFTSGSAFFASRGEFFSAFFFVPASKGSGAYAPDFDRDAGRF